MKKISLICLLLVFCFVMASCGTINTEQEEVTVESEPESTEESVTETTVANPVVDYDSLEEINELIGCTLVSPGVMGVSDDPFSVIDNRIAQYRFSVNGRSFNFRSGKSDHDISGIYINAALAFPELPTDSSILYAKDDEYRCACWVNDFVYSLTVENSDDIDDVWFEAIVEELKATSEALAQ